MSLANRHLASGLLAVCALVVACATGIPTNSATGESKEQGTEVVVRPESCPLTAPAPTQLPGVQPQQSTLDYWLARTAKLHDLDKVLLSPGEIANLNRSASKVRRQSYHPQIDLLAAIDREEVQREVTERLEYGREQIARGVLSDEYGQPLQLPAELSVAGATPELRIALEAVPIHCYPVRAGLYKKPIDTRYDRNKCSTARPQEAIRVIARHGDFLFVHMRLAFGWIKASAPLSPPVPDELHDSVVAGARVLVSAGPVTSDDGAATIVLEAATLLPDAGNHRVHFTTARGVLRSSPMPKRTTTAQRPLTRRAFLEEGFAFLGSAWGFGGNAGGRDCSRFTLDLFERFDIRLPRHSAWQSVAGSFSIDVAGTSETDRALLIDSAAQRGVVLLHFPGHIMMYLGRNEEGGQMALHSFGDYAESCPEAPSLDTAFVVDRVSVTNLELGRGSTRGAYIERIDRIAVLGSNTGLALAGVADLRPAADVEDPKRCRSSRGFAVFSSPKSPVSTQPLRIIVSSSRDPGPAELVLVDPEGKRHRPKIVDTGGPPFGVIAQVDAPRPGRWKVLYGDGDHVLACDTVRVNAKLETLATASSQVIWEPTRAWDAHMENLYAIFVERLFDYPAEDDTTWPSLHAVVRNKERNVLADYLRPGDDDDLKLQPDCADLPVTLRAYFAWKVGLPFGLRQCSRAKGGKPPLCTNEGADNFTLREEVQRVGDIAAFQAFVRFKLQNIVHSSSARTRPEAEQSDYYPVPLTRRTLKPGTLFADPYGHLLVVVDWIPQTIDRYGVLMAADAQPDGTVGRRRFWRGSFLFDPDTRAGGAGFKAYRVRKTTTGEEQPAALVAFSNEELQKSRQFSRFDMTQYEGSKQDFYDRMEALINPRPLDPKARMTSLVDALEEQVVRRVVSIDNGEKFIASRNFQPIDMPDGAAIFLTTGPWEDYSTPSRDLRLLIAVDSVLEFPNQVQRAPERYGRKEDDRLAAFIVELRKHLSAELEKRVITYERSDSSQGTLTLAQLVERRELLEMAYNPNDCVEIRWLALEGSPEMASCTRHAPKEQRRRMEDRYRPWFSTRNRPPN